MDNNPAVRLVSGEHKKEAGVHHTLSQNNQHLFASRYQLYLLLKEGRESF
jgi:hypothetical protein